MSLFREKRERTDHRRIQVGESAYVFIDRCAWPQLEQVRDDLNRIFDIYPAAHRERLRSRLAAREDDVFEGALFELFLFAYMTFMGYRVDVADDAEPDFIVRYEESPPVHVEATVMRGPEKWRRHDDRVDQLMMSAGRLVADRTFGLAVHRVTMSERNPSPGRFATFVETVRAAMDAGSGTSDRSAPHARQAHQYVDEQSGWKIQFEVIPLQRERREGSSLMVIGGSSGGGLVGPESVRRLQTAIRRKATKYRDLCHPLIVAVAANEFLTSPDDIEVEEALFESPAGVWSRGQRTPAAVLLVHGCYPSGVATSEPFLWPNPHVGDSILPRWNSHVRVWRNEDQRIHWVDACPPCTLREWMD